MKPLQTILFGGALLLVSVGSAWAQSGDASSSGATQTQTTPPPATQTQTPPAPASQTQTTPAPTPATQPSADTKATMSAEGSATASADADAAVKEIRERATKASAKGRAAVDKQLKKISADVDAEANAKGKAVAAGRVAPEFGMTGEALAAESDQFNAGLGEVIIAHMLLANSKTPVTVAALFDMRKDGMGWGQIAQGLNLKMGEVASAAAKEGKIAQGTAKSTGKVAMIHSASAHASTHAGLDAGAKAGKTGAAGSVGVGGGVDTKVGK